MYLSGAQPPSEHALNCCGADRDEKTGCSKQRTTIAHCVTDGRAGRDGEVGGWQLYLGYAWYSVGVSSVSCRQQHPEPQIVRYSPFHIELRKVGKNLHFRIQLQFAIGANCSK